MIKLYENIKSYRKLNGWSQEELAKKMGYTDRSMIAKIEAGVVDLAQSKIIEFAKVFGVDPGDLMGWTDESGDSTIYKQLAESYKNKALSEKAQYDPEIIEPAVILYELYKQASPEIQAAVETLLRSQLRDS